MERKYPAAPLRTTLGRTCRVPLAPPEGVGLSHSCPPHAASRGSGGERGGGGGSSGSKMVQEEKLENGHCGQAGPALGSRAANSWGTCWIPCRDTRLSWTKEHARSDVQRERGREYGAHGLTLPPGIPSASPRPGLLQAESHVCPGSGSGLGASEVAEGPWPSRARARAWPA